MINFLALFGGLWLVAGALSQPVALKGSPATAEPLLLPTSPKAILHLSKRGKDAYVDRAPQVATQESPWAHEDLVHIATFLRGDHAIFPSTSPSNPAVQELAAMYRPYQRSFQDRGISQNGLDAVTIGARLTLNEGRDRIRQMHGIVQYLLDHAEALGLDPIRIRYLEALQHRFSFDQRALTPTMDEIVSRATTRSRLIPDEALGSLLAGTMQELRRVNDYLGIRREISERHTRPFAIDFALLAHLEGELDRVVSSPHSPAQQIQALLRHSRRDLAEDKEPHQASTGLGRRDTLTMLTEEMAEGQALSPNPNEHGRNLLYKRQPPSQRDFLRPAPWPRREIPASVALSLQMMSPTDPGAAPIAEFWRRTESLLAPMRDNERRRSELDSMYQQYKAVVPITGRALTFDDAHVIAEHTTDAIGRDRFRHMIPILNFLIEHHPELHLDGFRLAYIRALLSRFQETERLLTPTVDEEARHVLDRGVSISRADQPTLSMISSTLGRISARLGVVQDNLPRIAQDLRFVNHVEREIEAIVTDPASIARGARRLVPRDRIEANDGDQRQGKTAIEKRAGGQEAPTDEEVRDILSPIGMTKHDEAALPIAAWRLSEEPLMHQEHSPTNFRAALRGGWMAYRAKHPVTTRIVPLLDEDARLEPYLNSDKSARFSSIVRVIDSMLESPAPLRLSSAAVEYLRGLKVRFLRTAELMEPLPSVVREDIRRDFPQLSPAEHAKMFRDFLFGRTLEIARHGRQIRIDDRLLESLESQLDFAHSFALPQHRFTWPHAL